MKAARQLALAAAMAALAVTASASAPAAAAPPSVAAEDGPGAASHFALARKDCVGTARNRSSKVWWTVADGQLSDVYFPTVDNTNNETLQYVVTDGFTFTDLQARDMTYTVAAPDDRALTCRVTATARSGRYRIVTDYLADPDRPTVIMRARFEALQGDTDDYRLYVRFDPNLNGNGGGGTDNAGADSGSVATSAGRTVLVGSDPVTATNAANRDYAVPVWSALDASTGFSEVANGFAGEDSDGLSQLDADHTLSSQFDTAGPGNLVQTGRVRLDDDGEFRLALGFGDSKDGALDSARRSLARPWGLTSLAYRSAWHAYNDGLERPARPAVASTPEWRELLDTYYLSADYVKAAEDKTFPGAVGAALASPWGQAIEAGDDANTYFGSYREVFARDLYQAWTALFLAGDRETAEDMTRFLFERQQQPDGSMPRNSLPNGKLAPDSFNTQLDECAFPLVMALAVGLDGAQYYDDHIKPAANFVASRGPAFGPERWEEQSGFSPSTLASEIAGLLAAAEIADRNGDGASARAWRGVADEFQRRLKDWTLTTVDVPEVSNEPYFIRLSKNGDPNADISYNLNNGGPTLDQKEVIDAGFLEYARLGVLSEDDPDLVRSLDVVDDVIARQTDSGEGFLRYNGDGYGDRSSDGRPWPPSFQGNGHVWPVLTGERGQWELDRGLQASALARLRAMAAMSSGVGLIAEQAWELADLARDPFGTEPPETASIGFENGKPAGSASALTWSAGQFVRLALDLAAGEVLDRPAYTTARYVEQTQEETPLAVTAPPDESAAGPSVTVTGTSAPGNTITVAATNTEGETPTVVRETTAGAGGGFSVDVPITGGTWVLNVVATSPAGATGHERRTVVFDADPGTLIAEFTDPDGDDNGPGNYVYPTSSNFKPGAYDLQLFQVFDAGDKIVFRVRTRDLTPTFGSALGAQLVDVYVHVPGAAPTSTAASFPQRNYTIEPDGAWSRLIEVQGFGQRYIDASGATLGTVSPLRGNAISRFITFGVPKASLGTPGPGWGFTVVLTGQDGFSPDQARGFQTAPQEFQFGVCAPGGTGPFCTVDPSTVPKALDIVVPPGRTQQAELDYTAGPVGLPPVTIP